MVITRFLPYSGLILEHAHVPMASSFAVGHSEFADSVPGWHTFFTGLVKVRNLTLKN